MTILEEVSVEELPKRKESKLFAIFLALFCYYLGASHFYLRQYLWGATVLISFLTASVMELSVWLVMLAVAGFVHAFVISKDQTFCHKKLMTKRQRLIIWAIIAFATIDYLALPSLAKFWFLVAIISIATLEERRKKKELNGKLNNGQIKNRKFITTMIVFFLMLLHYLYKFTLLHFIRYGF